MNKYFITYCLIFLTIAIGIISCNKNNTVEFNSSPTIEMSDNGRIIYNKLVAFKHDLENSQKSGTLMTIDSATWYIEAYYNVTSGYPDSAYHKFDIDSATYTISVDENNMISVTDLSTLISDMETQLSTLISQAEPENAHLVVGDVNINHVTGSSYADVIVTTGLGLGTAGMYTQFPDDECWFFGMTAGRCDLNPPTPPYEDAGDQLEWRFNNPNPLYTPCPSCPSGAIKIVNSSFVWNPGYEHSLIYSEWYAGAEDYPGYYGPYWNNYLNHGNTLFYGNVQSGGLVPDGNNFFTSVDITTYSLPFNNNGTDGYRYYHGYTTFYSIFECLPILE